MHSQLKAAAAAATESDDALTMVRSELIDATKTAAAAAAAAAKDASALKDENVALGVRSTALDGQNKVGVTTARFSICLFFCVVLLGSLSIITPFTTFPLCL
jgi:hypothetical protein